jgi:arginase
MSASPTIRVIGVPMDLGQSRRGVDMGPSAIRHAGLHERLRSLGYVTEDAGNVDIPERATLATHPERSFLSAVVDGCTAAYDAGALAIADDRFPIFLGGDHSMSAGTVGGVSAAGPIGLLWIDAHADANTPETSPTGNIHGMPLSALMGLGAPSLVNLGRPGPKIPFARIALIGLRDVDPGERLLLRDHGVAAFTMTDVDEHGAGDIARRALTHLSGIERLHVSLDMDVVDPLEAPGVGTPVPGGLTYREAHLVMEVISRDGRVRSADLVEVNPILDEHNRTAEMAVELIASLLGKSIL